MNLNKSDRKMKVAEAANAACSFVLPKKLKERYQMACKCFVWLNFCHLPLLGKLPHTFSYIIAILTHNHSESPNIISIRDFTKIKSLPNGSDALSSKLLK
jgi:hypothetical protein